MLAMQMGTKDSIRLDGVLDESIWQAAIPASDFRQQDPQNGARATEPTEVRIAYSRDALYMGVTCYDSESDRWLGFQRGRDGFLGSDDRFMWTIDTFLDGRTAYFFEMNPSGLMADAPVTRAFQMPSHWRLLTSADPCTRPPGSPTGAAGRRCASARCTA